MSPRTDCILDVRITNIDADAPSNIIRRKPLASPVLLSPYREKEKNLEAWLNHQRRHFSPFVASCNGLLGSEAEGVEHYKKSLQEASP